MLTSLLHRVFHDVPFHYYKGKAYNFCRHSAYSIPSLGLLVAPDIPFVQDVFALGIGTHTFYETQLFQFV